jgi:ribonuclease R
MKHNKKTDKPKDKKTQSKSYEGLLSTNRKGTGFIPVDGFEEDIEIPREYIGTSLPGDFVEISLLPKKSGERQRAEVVRIITPGPRKYVGKVEKNKSGYFVIPDAKQMYTDIFVPHSSGKNAKNGEKVVVEIVSWKSSRENPQGKILEVLGKAGEHEVEIRGILVGHNIDTDFPKEVEEEAKKIGETGRKDLDNFKPNQGDRKDLREKTTFTIDPVDAKDFDDALSVKELSGGNIEVGVHIADVSYYVKEGSKLDKEAQERNFSTYLVDRTIPMLPEVLSNDLCSLRPNEDRFAFSAVFELKPNGEIVKEWFGRSIIHSDKRFSYEDAYDSLQNKGEYYKELSILNKMANILREEKRLAGALEFGEDEVKFVLNKDGSIKEIQKKQRLPTHHLIEEFMLLANRRIAHFIASKTGKKDRPFIYRIHDKPNPEKMEGLGVFLRAMGYELPHKGSDISSKDLQKLLASIEGSEIQRLAETSIIRSMAKAIYSVSNIGHFGLAFSHYTHFTSPIRRYPDLLVHRILQNALEGAAVHEDAYSKYSRLSRNASAKEIEVVQAERDSIKFKQAEYMSAHIGEVFEARIVGVVEYGLFVETLDERAEGLVPVRTMEGFYELDDSRYKLKRSSDSKQYQLGDTLKVKVVDARPQDREIDFKLVEN